MTRYEAARQRWRTARAQFTGLSSLAKARHDLRNIRRSHGSYEVVIIRDGNKFSTSIPGNGEESLRAAMELRDELVREARPIRKNAIPREVLQALGLSQPVIGVSRLASRSSYRVFWTDETGKHRLKAFYYRVIPEVDAYAAAVAFKEELDREKFLRRSRHGGATRWDESQGPLSLLGAR